MNTLKLILTILQLLSGLAVTVVVLLQSGKSAGLSGAIAGGAETFLSKGKAKSLDAKLANFAKENKPLEISVKSKASVKSLKSIIELLEKNKIENIKFVK